MRASQLRAYGVLKVLAAPTVDPSRPSQQVADLLARNELVISVEGISSTAEEPL